MLDGVGTTSGTADECKQRGDALVKAGQLDAALAAYDQALDGVADHAQSLNGRGVALARMGRLAEAVESFNRAIASLPSYARAHFNLGAALAKLGRPAEALASYDAALAIEPAYADAHNNRGVALVGMGRFREALKSYDQAVRLKPDFAEAHNNRGSVMVRLNQAQAAMASFDRAVALRPGYADAHTNRALQLLRDGRLTEGWAAYEWRTRRPGSATRTYDAPLWTGAEDIAGKTLFLHWEQGLGDTIQFCRYAGLAAGRGARVVLSAPPPLVRLFRQFEPDLTIVSDAEDAPPHDFQCPLMSLPRAFDTRLETIPSPPAYLRADPDLAAGWAARLPPRRRPRVGVVWSGNPAYPNDRNRSIEFRTLAPLLSLDADWICLQKALRPEDAGPIEHLGRPAFHGDALLDFAETAALIENLDLVVSVDTSVAHLAGAMGKPVWILLPFSPDWRWLVDRTDSLWYPSARLFRQPEFGDWEAVVGAVKVALASELKAIRRRSAARASERPSEAVRRQAVALHRAGRLDEAEPLYRQALDLDADDFDAQHLLGVVLAQTDRPDEAEARFRRAIAVKGDDPSVYGNLGTLLIRTGRFEEALATFDRLLALAPDRHDAHDSRGVVLGRLRRPEEALASFDRALALSGEVGLYHFNRGLVLAELKRDADALAALDRAATLQPDRAEPHRERGLVLKRLSRLEEALAAFDTAVALKPDYAAAHSGRGAVLTALRRPEEALSSIDQALGIDADHAYGHNARGSALRMLGDLEAAIACYDRAIELSPDYVDAYLNRGVAMASLNRFDEAMAEYERALTLRPGCPVTLTNKGHQFLKFGRLEEGWPLYEWRKLQEGHAAARICRSPAWTGREDVSGKRVFLHWEQGLGDTIQFCRYARLVADRGAQVVLSAQAPLTRLLQQFRPGIEIIGANQEPVESDFHAALMSLPLAFGHDLASIPSTPAYLSADPELAAEWRRRLPPGSRKRVGVVWSGNPDFKNDHNRSIPLKLMRRLFKADVDWVCLQKDIREADAPAVKRLPRMSAPGPELGDFADTAAIIDQLDLVVSVDTSVAHLAGAMGKPVWILLPFSPDWRWMLERTDSPWYPSARLFRQPGGRDWPAVIEAVEGELGRWLGAG